MNIELKSLEELRLTLLAYGAITDPLAKSIVEFIWKRYVKIVEELSQLPDDQLHEWALDNGYTKIEIK